MQYSEQKAVITPTDANRYWMYQVMNGYLGCLFFSVHTFCTTVVIRIISLIIRLILLQSVASDSLSRCYCFRYCMDDSAIRAPC